MLSVLALILAASPLPDGESWVPRLVEKVGSRGAPGARTETRWETSCEQLDVRGPLVKLGQFTFNQREGKLFAPTLTSPPRPVPLMKHCADEIPTTPRFDTRQACVEATPHHVSEVCDGGACSLTPPPFRLPSCDAVMKELAALDALAGDHAQALKSLERVTAISKHGGRLWQRGDCAVVSVKASRDGVTLRGPDWEVIGVLEPLFGRARLAGSTGWSLDGGLGTWGTSGSTEAMLLGDGLFVLGTRVLYFERAACAAAGR